MGPYISSLFPSRTADGSTAAARSSAARQIGEIGVCHRTQLPSLLRRVRPEGALSFRPPAERSVGSRSSLLEASSRLPPAPILDQLSAYICSSKWETRIAAGEAIAALAEGTPHARVTHAATAPAGAFFHFTATEGPEQGPHCPPCHLRPATTRALRRCAPGKARGGGRRPAHVCRLRRGPHPRARSAALLLRRPGADCLRCCCACAGSGAAAGSACISPPESPWLCKQARHECPCPICQRFDADRLACVLITHTQDYEDVIPEGATRGETATASRAADA